jgi:hypothetical protein
MKANRQGSKDQVAIERRTGVDRRQKDVGGPNGRERRKSMEPRKREVIELDVTTSEWAALEGGDGYDGLRGEKAGV